jgi:hypothetical protein
MAARASGSSSVGAWPTPGTVTHSALECKSVIFWTVDWLRISEEAPRRIRSGMSFKQPNNLHKI